MVTKSKTLGQTGYSVSGKGVYMTVSGLCRGEETFSGMASRIRYAFRKGANEYWNKGECIIKVKINRKSKRHEK
jgi:hypothetical protein